MNKLLSCTQSEQPTDEPTISDVLVALNQFSSHLESVMITKTDLADQLHQFKIEFKKELKSELKEELKTELVAELSQRLVTKDYLDQKMASLRDDVLGLTHQEDRQIVTLVNTLQNNNVITTNQTKAILMLGPFNR